MLEVNGLTKKYNKVVAADNVSFTIADGQIGVIMGPNGSGKSTTIKSIAGLLRHSGEITIQGYDNKSVEAKKVFGYVPEIPSMFSLLTVREHLIYTLKAYGKKIDEEKITSLLKTFELEDKQDKLGDELSKGMMQKVSICCALVIEPKVLMLDEPMVGLDPKAIKELKKVVLELKEKGTTILISTHMLDMVEGLWDTIVILKNGKVLGQFDKDMAEGKNLDEIFFKVTGDLDA
ncbi:ABC transporter ATP-binding protein [Lagierella sp.]|uniref:ABC transporter ATP-binding protein n=1 Tax=Lagierella sp. TaxID=2849657 RepID=UPI0026398A4A|nr:ABC transporter ATP-binding protein [Lagierella sp.]